MLAAGIDGGKLRVAAAEPGSVRMEQPRLGAVLQQPTSRALQS
jgi:hypothetical protein